MLLIVILLLFFSPAFVHQVVYSVDFKLFFFTSFLVVTMYSYLMEQLRHQYLGQFAQRIDGLQEVYNSIRTLKGMVPVCSNCKSVRNDDGYWTELEQYLVDHTDLMLSHSICASCIKKEMPEIYEEMVKAGEIQE
jgi:hypothetical protein